MDYEKKYKEAVNKIKNLLDDSEKNGFTIVTYKTDLESIFPELCESEDEQIRKRIIHALHGDVLDMEETNKAIAWLEKQGEQKPFDYEHANIQQKDFAPKDSYAIKENGSPYPTKPAVFSEKKPKRMISAEVKEAMYDKPAWSEEDEKMVDNILTPLATRYPFDIYQPMYNWLKSLKERIGG